MKFIAHSGGLIDFERGSKGLAKEDTLGSAVLISLLTDRRAAPDDELPENSPVNSLVGSDRRGWAGDMLADDDGDRIGSRLWLLVREKQTEETRQRAISYCHEALQWLIDDGQAESVEIEAEWTALGRLDADITINQVSGTRYALGLSDLTGAIHAV